MSERNPDDIEFDFFDEPDEETVTQRRRAVRPTRPQSRGPRPPRGPIAGPGGLTPLLRLVGLIAVAILAVVLLVFWVQGCQSDAKVSAYKNYMADVTTIAQASQQVGRNLNDLLTTPGIKLTDLENKLDSFADQEKQDATRANALRPPGHLRGPHGGRVAREEQPIAAAARRLDDVEVSALPELAAQAREAAASISVRLGGTGTATAAQPTLAQALSHTAIGTESAVAPDAGLVTELPNGVAAAS